MPQKEKLAKLLLELELQLEERKLLLHNGPQEKLVNLVMLVVVALMPSLIML